MFSQGQVEVMTEYLQSVTADFRTDVLGCSTVLSAAVASQFICTSTINQVKFEIEFDFLNPTGNLSTFTLTGLHPVLPMYSILHLWHRAIP